MGAMMVDSHQQVPVPSVFGATDDLLRSAREALNTLVTVEKCLSREPDPRVDWAAWREWHDDAYHPAHRRWTRAMDQLDGLISDQLPEHASDNWVSVCVRILSGELR